MPEPFSGNEPFSGSEADDGVDECITSFAAESSADLDGVDECSADFVEDNAGTVCDLGSPGRRVDLER